MRMWWADHVMCQGEVINSVLWCGVDSRTNSLFFFFFGVRNYSTTSGSKILGNVWNMSPLPPLLLGIICFLSAKSSLCLSSTVRHLTLYIVELDLIDWYVIRCKRIHSDNSRTTQLACIYISYFIVVVVSNSPLCAASNKRSGCN